MAATIKIEKSENGNIFLTGLTGARVNRQLNPNTASFEYVGGTKQTFNIWDAGQKVLSFPFSQVAFTQIMPAEPVAVTDLAAFITLMRTSFFLPN